MRIRNAVFSSLAIVLASCSIIPAKDIDVDKYNSVDDMITAEFSKVKKIALIKNPRGASLNPFSTDHSIAIFNNLKKYCEVKSNGSFKRLNGPEKGGYLDAENIISRAGLFSCERNESVFWYASVEAVAKLTRALDGSAEPFVYIRARKTSDNVAQEIIRNAAEEKKRQELLAENEKRYRALQEKRHKVLLERLAVHGYGAYLCYEHGLGREKATARIRRVLDNGWIEVVILERIINYKFRLNNVIGKTEVISDPIGWSACLR